VKKLPLLIGFLILIACVTTGRIAPPEPLNPGGGKLEPTQPLHTSTPAPNPTVPPTNVSGDTRAAQDFSDGEALRQFMLTSHQRWDSLWADGQVDYYNPGDQTPIQSTHVQIWVEQPARFRLLTGPTSGAPDDQWISDGSSIRQRGEAASPLPPYIREPFNPPTGFSDTISTYPLSGSIVSPLRDMIFPTGLAQREGVYKIIGYETYASREIVLLDWSYTPGAVADRFWVDAATGVILHWQNFGKGGLQGLNTEMIITQIQYNLKFPESIFSINALLPEKFSASPSDLP
jgi:hypothetical protein